MVGEWSVNRSKLSAGGPGSVASIYTQMLDVYERDYRVGLFQFFAFVDYELSMLSSIFLFFDKKKEKNFIY